MLGQGHLVGQNSTTQPICFSTSTGKVIAIWQQYDDLGNYYIKANTQSNGVWNTSSTLSANGQTALLYQYGIDNFGNALVVWLGVDPNTANRYVFANTYSQTGGWSAPVQISTTGNPVNPSIVPIEQITVVNTAAVGSTFVTVWCAYDSTLGQINIYSASISYNILTGWGSWGNVVLVSS